MCILIVEDDPTSAKVIETNLNKNGYKTTTASSGKQALQYLADREFELILLDVMISEIGGLELLTKIRDHADQNKIPLFMCTAPTLEQIAAGKKE
jgi:DNA-binding response OmpR family regulator